MSEGIGARTNVSIWGIQHPIINWNVIKRNKLKIPFGHHYMLLQLLVRNSSPLQ